MAQVRVFLKLSRYCTTQPKISLVVVINSAENLWEGFNSHVVITHTPEISVQHFELYKGEYFWAAKIFVMNIGVFITNRIAHINIAFKFLD